ncbi:MAG: hypothetical protein HXL11_03330 [Candidatus Nanosynbacter sp.]|nr:hypothetical protein [Candidatus Nanosynbacter sp.]
MKNPKQTSRTNRKPWQTTENARSLIFTSAFHRMSANSTMVHFSLLVVRLPARLVVSLT